MACSMLIVETGVPQMAARKRIDHEARGAIGKSSSRQANVPLEDAGVGLQLEKADTVGKC